MFFVSSRGCLCPIHWSQALSHEWRYIYTSWSSADGQCSNYIWMINNLTAYWGVSYIGGFTVYKFNQWFKCHIHYLYVPIFCSIGPIYPSYICPIKFTNNIYKHTHPYLHISETWKILDVSAHINIIIVHVLCMKPYNSKKTQGAVSIRKTVLPGMAIPMLKIRRPNGRLIFNMEIPIRR